MTRSTTSDPLVGDVLDGRYEVLTRLARGGMATVYRAWDRRLERIVAIKVMHEGLGDDADFTAKFDREARAAARLCDRSVVGIFDQGQDHGRPYIVMEFVEGATLRNVITADAPMSPLRALEMIEPVAAALALAHDSGLVHRDVKPENVLISSNGVVKVADFGLARTITAQTATATQGLLIGTVSYLPPELLTTGRAHSWSDIYSTGIVLFEMLTGRKPYAGETPITVAYKHVNEDVPAPSQFLARHHPAQARREPIPDYVDALVLACTRRNPQARPADGRELLRRVRRARQGLEKGIHGDEALVAIMFPTAQLPWTIDIPPASPAKKPSDAIRTGTTPSVGIRQVSPDGVPTAVRPSITAAGRRARSPVRPAASPAASAELPVGPQHVNPDGSGARKPVSSPARPVVRGVVYGSATEASPTTPSEYDDHALGRSPSRAPRRRIAEIRRRRRFVMLSLIGLLILGLSVTGWWFLAGRYITTPSMLNQNQAEATAMAEANGLTVSFTEQYSETVPAGLVISTEPAPGDRVIRGSQIAAVLSLGPERYLVPKLVGLELQQAKAALTAANLRAGTITEAWDDQIPAGVVIWASQPEGEPLKRDSLVDLTVSKGREPVTIPKVTDMPLADAQKLLTDAGFVVTVTAEEYHDTVPRGSVIKQTPESGTGYRGDAIQLVVSKGKPVEMIELRDVLDKDMTAAHRQLTEDGFQVSRDPQTGVLPPRVGRVILDEDIELPDGTKLTKGTELSPRTKLPKGTRIYLQKR